MQEDGKTADKVVVQDKRSIYYVRYPNLAIYCCLTMASGHSLPILYHSFPPSPAKLAGKGLSNGPLRSVQRWSECSALISVLSAESLKLMYALSDTEWCRTELGFTSVEQSNGVFTIKNEITTTRIELWTTWKKSHDQKLAISTCTLLQVEISAI